MNTEYSKKIIILKISSFGSGGLKKLVRDHVHDCNRPSHPKCKKKIINTE